MSSMNYVSTELNLPIFLVSRNRMKYQHPDVVRKYIAKRRKQYMPLCRQGKELEENPTATYKKYQHIVGLDQFPKPECPAARPLKISRDLISAKVWQLPPNRYDVPGKPFAGLQGSSGAYWPKLGTNESRVATSKAPKPHFRFYDTPREMERFNKMCHKHKGILLSNARERRPTTRCMVSSLIGCYRDPKDPNATTYNSDIHTIEHNISFPIKYPAPNPHLFLPQSCVPAKPNAVHPKNSSFKPGPGRYENRYVHVCHCTSKRIYAPGFHLAIEREKRYKFRRLPYTKIKARLYCTPEWRHVIGNGYRRLFKKVTNTDAKLKVSKEVKKSDKTLNLYVDSKYIQMINSPSRDMVSVWAQYPKSLPTRVYYNCTAKRTVRRQLRNNKKIAFLSGQDRFKDADRPIMLTNNQLQKIIKSLPQERQLRNHPITRTPVSQIESKLNETPLHMLPSFALRLRKRLFKFLPLPGPKVLVRKTQTFGNKEIVGYYGAEYKTDQFLKSKSES